MAPTEKNEAKKTREKKEVVQEELSMESNIEHELIPKHQLLTEEEKKALLEKYKIELKQLPKIPLKDPVVKSIEASVKVGDVIEINRSSVTAGQTKYYRMIVHG